MKINNKEFLKYMVENCPSNLTFIKSFRLNKKSISVKIEKDYRFNNMFSKDYLYNLIIAYLSSYIKENNIEFSSDRDYLKYRFNNLNVNR